MTVVNITNKFFSELENVTVASDLPFLCEVGKIKIGTKGEERTSKTGKAFRLPRKLDHFVVTTNFKDPHTDTFVPDVALMEQIASATNQDPNNLKFLPVMLLFDNPELNFIVRFSCYKSATAWCIGDGKKAFRLKNNNGEREEVKCPCNRVLPNYNGQEKCKVFGRLILLLQGVKRLGGVWVFRTTSWNSVRSIQASMVFLRQLTGGILAGIPLMLTINPKAVITPNGTPQTVYVVNLEYWGDIESLLEHAMRIQKRRIEYKLKVETLEEQLKKSLPAIQSIQFDEDEKDIAEEFYPENLWDEDQSETQPETQPQPEPQEKQEKAEEKTSAEPEEPQKEDKKQNESTEQQEEREPTQSKQPEVLTLW